MLSRRDFLKALGGLGGGLLLSAWTGSPEPLTGWQGRVASGTLPVRKAPDPDSPILYSYWRDLVFPITEIALSADTQAYNRVWYRLGEAGYAYSGDVQPVRTEIQTPQTEIASRGQLAEVSVPYTDARQAPNFEADVAYRLYYATTYWLTGALQDADGNIWYRIYDDRFNTTYYALGKHLRLVSAEEVAPISPELARPYKKLEVRLSQQLVVAYEHSRPVFVCRASTGVRLGRGNYSTPTGWYVTFHKRPSRHMAAGDPASNGFDLPGVPWVTYITESGISFHGTYWHNDFGTPHSHGCINLSPQAARWIYRWTLPSVPLEKMLAYRKGYGTYVEIIA